MKATKKNTTAKKPSIETKEVSKSDAAALKTALSVESLHGDELLRAVMQLNECELESFMSSESVSRVVRIVAVSLLEDIDVLIGLAASDAPTFVRKNALLRLEEVLDGNPVEEQLVGRLLPCLQDEDLIAFAVSLMDMCNFNWWAYCDRTTTLVLCSAMNSHRSISELVLLEDALSELVYRRPDLVLNLQACISQKFIFNSVCAPMIANSSSLVTVVA